MLVRSTCRLISTNVNFTFNVTTSHNNRFFTNLDPISFPAKIRADRNMIINQEYRGIHRHHRGQMANANVINGNHNRTTFVVEQYGPPTNRIPNQFNWKGVTVSPYAFPIIPIVKLDLHYPKIKYINGKRTRYTHPHTQPRPFPAITLSLPVSQIRLFELDAPRLYSAVANLVAISYRSASPHNFQTLRNLDAEIWTEEEKEGAGFDA